MGRRKDLIKGNAINRYYPRIDVEILFAYRPVSAPGEEKQVGSTKSLGLGGLMFEAEHPLPVGSTFHLDLVFGEDKMGVNGKVVYSNRIGVGNYQVGFCFLELDEQMREKLTNYFIEEYERFPQEDL